MYVTCYCTRACRNDPMPNVDQAIMVTVWEIPPSTWARKRRGGVETKPKGAIPKVRETGGREQTSLVTRSYLGTIRSEDCADTDVPPS